MTTPEWSTRPVPAQIPAVRVRAARRRYDLGDETVNALNDLSVDFHRRTFTAVMGPSGSGKSTLLQCAAGLDKLDGGETFIGDVEVGSLSEQARTLLRRSKVGFVFQSYNLIDSLTAIQNLELPLRLAGRKPERSRITAGLTRVGLGDRMHHRPSQLSGGQQQRVAVARALVSEPEVVFADEPTGALDSAGSRSVLELLRSVVDHEGQTVVMVTHDPTAASFADRVLFLRDGKVVDDLQHRRGVPGDNRTAAQIAARMTEVAS
ncbi:ABC transporter ATP-binding protein [Rhodococcus sp. H29-C3]|uniref:ABC transporter ATP-binding protein n=1 Tax=Rhodococcus sp. H29-C3 TaxID=3046307 RepID=UPI0024BA9BD5|nr:ABC transporter ATP-binding protein [Rhodococcus sp. H29-C3]MDJ0362793.1 ABC transporter ATP-binding protein [Rhodococcus sp. H29-C3]